MAKFPKPTFASLKASYSVPSSSVHECKLVDPTKSGINTCAIRMSEALVIANGLVKDRVRISHPFLDVVLMNFVQCNIGAAQQTDVAVQARAFKQCAEVQSVLLAADAKLVKEHGTEFLLGAYNYAEVGKLCPHGLGRGAQDLGNFLANHWGARTLGWTKQAAAPKNIQGKVGVVLFMKIPGFDGQGHIDLWDKTGPVGADYWDSETIWFWELA